MKDGQICHIWWVIVHLAPVGPVLLTDPEGWCGLWWLSWHFPEGAFRGVMTWDSSWMGQTQNNKLSQMTYQKWRVTVLSTYYICEFWKGLVIPLPLKSYSALSNKLHGSTHGGDSPPRQARWSGDRPANFQDLQQLGTAMVIVGKPANKNTSDLPEMSGTSTISQRKAWCLPHWNYSCWSTEFWSQPQLQPNTVIACNCQLKNH